MSCGYFSLFDPDAHSSEIWHEVLLFPPFEYFFIELTISKHIFLNLEPTLFFQPSFIPPKQDADRKILIAHSILRSFP